jgi:hypothetical protein
MFQESGFLESTATRFYKHQANFDSMAPPHFGDVNKDRAYRYQLEAGLLDDFIKPHQKQVDFCYAVIL